MNFSDALIELKNGKKLENNCLFLQFDKKNNKIIAFQHSFLSPIKYIYELDFFKILSEDWRIANENN